MATDGNIKDLKIKRRNAKAALTRQGNAIYLMMQEHQAPEEVRSQLQRLEVAFDDLVKKHEVYTELIDNEEEFNNEEAWLAECQHRFISTHGDARKYLDTDKNEEKLLQLNRRKNQAQIPAQKLCNQKMIPIKRRA
ncbi:uncharacterized protein LOC117125358 [Anneissia japonica]|uniref:uncharacterized protein LOC117125358 n=1 Tax=Anneissia japonica TaxID=1529436 RepID=UPI001425631D|nr:uncharacterized protein LOC117125358 [Anneissia japonica]